MTRLRDHHPWIDPQKLFSRIRAARQEPANDNGAEIRRRLRELLDLPADKDSAPEKNR